MKHTMLDSSTLHRGAKYFMDSGRAASHDEAMALMRSFGLSIHVGDEISRSPHQQVALLTLVNVARRTFLAGVDVVGLPDAKSLTGLAQSRSLKAAIEAYGGWVVSQPNPAWPSALIGACALPESSLPAWRLTWEGWRGGVMPAREVGCGGDESKAMALAPLVAAACCAAEVFAYHAEDHAMAGRRQLGMSLWNPGSDWLVADPGEPELRWLPSHLWIIGLGNLGQAFAWAIAALPYADTREVKLVLQDDDRLAASNDSTSLLSFLKDVGQRKARMIGNWLDARGFETFLQESRFGLWTKRSNEDPAVALCGVDNAFARAALEHPGFELVVEAGLGAGPEAFRSVSLHTFPASRSADEIWSKQIGAKNENVENMPAYQAMKDQGVDACGLTQLASRTVGAPFVGLIAGVLVISELLRRLHGGMALELVSGSVAALESIETIMVAQVPYAFGHVDARPS
jgi:hypothetical protein